MARSSLDRRWPSRGLARNSASAARTELRPSTAGGSASASALTLALGAIVGVGEVGITARLESEARAAGTSSATVAGVFAALGGAGTTVGTTLTIGAVGSAARGALFGATTNTVISETRLPIRNHLSRNQALDSITTRYIIQYRPLVKPRCGRARAGPQCFMASPPRAHPQKRAQRPSKYASFKRLFALAGPVGRASVRHLVYRGDPQSRIG